MAISWAAWQVKFSQMTAASAPFDISNGVKQGCVLASVLFKLFFTCVLNYAIRVLWHWGHIWSTGLDSSLFYLCHALLQRQRHWKNLFLEALFAEDCALMVHKESHLQLVLNKFSEVSKLFGLTISLDKTEIFHQPAPGTTTLSSTVSIDGTQLMAVETVQVPQ